STLRVASVFSHLATADCPDMNDYTEMQLHNYESMTDRMAAMIPYQFKRHILNTAGISRYPQYHYDMVRLGIGLYGIDPLGENPELETVARLSTTIIAVRRWPAGTTIGYGRRGLLKRDSLIATIPIGYADGIDRHFGCGNASFSVRDVLCPTVGNICMDLCMIDVTDAPGATVGDVVEIFGPSAPIQRLSDVQGTIPYEILASVSPRVRRIYFRE
ncbi:MAG: alanine racemase, partial [Muribaculaceae bacterium]|nr:alanine racemase [Muribaculaceae bacterium]